MPKIFHWSNGFSSTPCSLLQLSGRPGDQHISCQKYFTGPMVSHRPLFAVAAIPEAGWLALLVPKTFHWSNGFSSGGGPDFLRGYVGSVLKVEGWGCNSPCIAPTEDPIRSSHSKLRPLRWFRRYWGFGLSPIHQLACRLAPPDFGVKGRISGPIRRSSHIHSFRLARDPRGTTDGATVPAKSIDHSRKDTWNSHLHLRGPQNELGARGRL